MVALKGMYNGILNQDSRGNKKFSIRKERNRWIGKQILFRLRMMLARTKIYILIMCHAVLNVIYKAASVRMYWS